MRVQRVKSRRRRGGPIFLDCVCAIIHRPGGRQDGARFVPVLPPPTEVMQGSTIKGETAVVANDAADGLVFEVVGDVAGVD